MPTNEGILTPEFVLPILEFVSTPGRIHPKDKGGWTPRMTTPTRGRSGWERRDSPIDIEGGYKN